MFYFSFNFEFIYVSIELQSITRCFEAQAVFNLAVGSLFSLASYPFYASPPFCEQFRAFLEQAFPSTFHPCRA